LASAGLVDYAVAQGWCKDRATFSFKESYAGPGLYASYLYTLLSKADERESRLNELLQANKQQITPQTIMTILRDHGPQTDSNWSPGPGLFENSICMHAGWGLVRSGQTAGSLVSHLDADQQTHWITGSAAPCTGLFKPVWLDAGLPEMGPAPSGRYNYSSLWWRHEALHRAVLRDYALRLAVYQTERDALETGFVDEALALQTASVEDRGLFSTQAFTTAAEATQRWTDSVRQTPIQTPAPFLYRRAWQKFNQESKLIEGDAQKFTHMP
jgi:dipeptidase